MNQNRRKVLKALGGAGALAAAQPYLSFPALAQARTLIRDHLAMPERRHDRRVRAARALRVERITPPAARGAQIELIVEE